MKEEPNGMKTVRAIWSIRPKGQFSVDETYESLIWEDETQVKPTEQEFHDAVTAWNSNWTAQEYARNRQAEYPDWGSQLEKIADDGIDKWKSEMLAPVKAKFPKP